MTSVTSTVGTPLDDEIAAAVKRLHWWRSVGRWLAGAAVLLIVGLVAWGIWATVRVVDLSGDVSHLSTEVEVSDTQRTCRNQVLGNFYGSLGNVLGVGLDQRQAAIDDLRERARDVSRSTEICKGRHPEAPTTLPPPPSTTLRSTT